MGGGGGGILLTTQKPHHVGVGVSLGRSVILRYCFFFFFIMVTKSVPNPSKYHDLGYVSHGVYNLLITIVVSFFSALLLACITFTERG